MRAAGSEAGHWPYQLYLGSGSSYHMGFGCCGGRRASATVRDPGLVLKLHRHWIGLQRAAGPAC